jgi:hypothetical protein
MPDVIRVNNTTYSWTSCVATIDAQPYRGILAVNFKQKRERKKVYGMRRDGTPLARTSGKYGVESFTLKMLADSYDSLTDYLTAIGLGSYGDAEWTFGLQLFEPQLGLIKPINMFAENCTIVGEEDTHEEGVDEAVVSVDVDVMRITKNAKRLWSFVRSLP